MSNFEKALKHVLFVEGGYSDHPEDKGGKTKYGITELTFKHWAKKNGISHVSIKNMPKKVAEEIYKEFYWDEVRGGELPPGVALMVFDSAVHAGPLRARTWLQRALGVTPDGIIGPITLKAVSLQSSTHLIKEIAKYRLMLGRKNDTFAKGWFNRIIYILGACYEDVFNGRLGCNPPITASALNPPITASAPNPKGQF